MDPGSWFTLATGSVGPVRNKTQEVNMGWEERTGIGGDNGLIDEGYGGVYPGDWIGGNNDGIWSPGYIPIY